MLDDYIADLTRVGIKTYEFLKKLDDRIFDGVRDATMHRVKGIEFHHVFVVAVNKRIFPLISAADCEDSVLVSESMTIEKGLLYVALIRAQESVCITSYGTPSEILE